MKIKIEKILERATAEAERLWLKVLSDTDLQYYIVFGTTYTSQNQIYRIQRHAVDLQRYMSQKQYMFASEIDPAAAV